MDYLIHHMLRTSASRFPDKEALKHDERSLTFAEFAAKTAAFADGLRDAGVRRGDRVGICLEPSIDQTVAILAISQAGGVFVPIHHSLFPNQVAHIVRDCGMTGLVTDAAKLDRLAETLGISRSELIQRALHAFMEDSEGHAVTQALDAFVDSEVLICAEVLLRISNHLVSRSGRIEDVRRVASNPQPLAQCRQWLEIHLPGGDRLERRPKVDFSSPRYGHRGSS